MKESRKRNKQLHETFLRQIDLGGRESYAPEQSSDHILEAFGVAGHSVCHHRRRAVKTDGDPPASSVVR